MVFEIAPEDLGIHRPAGFWYCFENGIATESVEWNVIQDFPYLDEELLITENTVIWSVSGHVKRSFDFCDDGQKVTHALFTYFVNPNDKIVDRHDSSYVPPLGTRTRSLNQLNASVHDSRQSGTKEFVKDLSPRLSRALVVILEDLAHIFSLDGALWVIHVPFRVRRVLAAPRGLILERSLENLELGIRPYETLFTAHSPRFFSLIGPLDEFGLVVTDGIYSFGAHDELVYIGKGDDALLVTRNPEKKQIDIWKCSYAAQTEHYHPRPMTGASSSRRRSSFGSSNYNDGDADIYGTSLKSELNITLDRMAFVNNNQLPALLGESEGLRKEIFVTHIESFPSHCTKHTFTVFSIRPSPGIEVVSIFNKEESSLLILTFRRDEGFSPYLIDSVTIPAIGAAPLISKSMEKILIFSIKKPILKLSAPCSPDIEVKINYTKEEIIELVHPVGCKVSLKRSDGTLRRIFFDLEYKTVLVQKCFEAFKVILPYRDFEYFHAAFLHQKSDNSNFHEFKSFSVILFSCFLSGSIQPRHIQNKIDGNFSNEIIEVIIEANSFCQRNDMSIMRKHLSSILQCLHILSEDFKFDSATLLYCRQIIPVKAQMAYWLGWSAFVEKDILYDEFMTTIVFDKVRLEHLNVPQFPSEPYSVYHNLILMLKEKKYVPVPSIMNIAKTDLEYKNLNYIQGSKTISLLSKTIFSLYETLLNPKLPLQDVVTQMVEHKFTLDHLKRLPDAVSIPLRDAIRYSQENPLPNWGVEALRLIDRKDLEYHITVGDERPRRFPPTLSVKIPEPKDTKAICQEVLDPEIHISFDRFSEEDHKFVTKLIFREDRRLQEVSKLLQISKQAVARIDLRPEMSEHEIVVVQQTLAQIIAIRTLSIPVGRGLYFYSSKTPLPTEKFPIPGFNFTVKIKPLQVQVPVVKSFLDDQTTTWGLFHNGTAAALSITNDTKDISASWIVYNKPNELSNRHAGFLFGLGLNGHLKSMATWHAFNYLTSKHTMTSIGLLLGLSASFIGTMDPTITRLLSVHVLALLPPGSSELNLSTLTQTAGILGIGLLYYNTQHRRMSEVLLMEISKFSPPGQEFRDEGYRLSAGFALGLINIGKGQNLKGLQDLHIVKSLVSCISGGRHEETSQNLDMTSSGAVIALSLIYLKTNDEDVAKKIEIPATEHLLDYVRPDILLLRVLAKNCILWDKIDSTFEWIKNQLPPILRDEVLLTGKTSLDSNDMALFNIISGACFSMALRFVGTRNENAKKCLLHFLDKFMNLSTLIASTHDQKLCKTTVKNCLDVLCISSSCVMTGSGDLDVLRRLRKLHGRTDADITYGNHMATHMAIGILFLGGGQYSLGNSNLSIASMICAFYPQFPNSAWDNISHLQAFRHLWAISCESRCLIARDVNTLRPTLVPIASDSSYTFYDAKNAVAPCLLPPRDDISIIQTLSPQYWQASLALHTTPISPQKTSTMYISKRVMDSQECFNLEPLSQPSIERSILKMFLSESLLSNEFYSMISRLELSSQFIIDRALQQNEAINSKLLLLSDIKKENSAKLYGIQLLLVYAENISTGLLTSKYSGFRNRFLSDDFLSLLRLRTWNASQY
ncbi:hypothetical protein PNEG_00192 [Pneumocystis murina B123]|uniref:Anaphase-promoting complex subunit 1 N-terminal domain-containing protein n=1 Tax=Pneumocystis murina (strain B123) TaxID=1069680 RepID=M7PD06_PNEMU|nr:hypothetical protein PNEG_00192 [Pneumocystis murina B123]EMR11760.1 hypothetical protein PNEG_00192 [Pneumocystis murina B123]